MVTTCVVVWIEMIPLSSTFQEARVTTCVVVWIEIGYPVQSQN